MNVGDEEILATEDDVHEAWDKAELYAESAKRLFGSDPPFRVGVKPVRVKQGKANRTAYAIYLKKTREA